MDKKEEKTDSSETESERQIKSVRVCDKKNDKISSPSLLVNLDKNRERDRVCVCVLQCVCENDS